jgi:preprotein translocase subunit SecA
MLSRAGMKAGEAIESKLLSRQIERAQRKVEAHNFDIRKQLLEYDDVANDQRRVVYQQRAELMEASEISDAIRNIRAEVVNSAINEHVAPESVEEEWDKAGLSKSLEREFGVRLDVVGMLEADHSIDEKRLRELTIAAVADAYERKVAEIGPNIMHEIEKQIMLRQLDSHWKEHIGALDYLRQGIHLRGYAQRNPKQEYKREAFEMFSTMLERVKHDTISILSKIQIRRPEDVQAVEPAMPDPSTLKFQHAAAPALVPAAPAAPPPDAWPPAGPAPGGPGMRPPPLPPADPVAPYVRETPKVGRNDPCPCGSGKKYKQCHGRLS